MRIAIAGVGVAGGVIATGLAQLPGVEVLAFEKVGLDDHASAGNGLNVGPNAMLALQRALPEMAARLRDHSLPWRQWRANTMAGELLYEVPLHEVAVCDGIRIRWADLYRECRAQAGAAVRYHAEVRDVEQAADGRLRVRVVHADARVEEIADIDLLVAADGRYSALRQQLCGSAPVRHLGVGNFRVLLDDGGEWPIRDLEQWFHGPHRLLAFRLQGGLVYLSGNIPIEVGEDIPDQRRTAQWLEEAYTPADGVMAEAPRRLLRGACRAADRGELHWSRLQEGTTCWHDDSARVLFPGDAAHPMVPTLGQGATTAIEDGAVFVEQFGAALATGAAADLQALVRGYATARADRTAFIRRFSWEASDVLRDTGAAYEHVRAKGAGLRRLYGSE
jgi:salicylate hydroxylase